MPPLSFTLEERNRKKKTQISGKGTPEETWRRPVRPLVPRVKARPCRPSVFLVMEERIQLSALASKPARVAQSAEFQGSG